MQAPPSRGRRARRSGAGIPARSRIPTGTRGRSPTTRTGLWPRTAPFGSRSLEKRTPREEHLATGRCKKGMRKLLLILGAVLVAPPAANAKVCATVRVLPERPVAGKRAELRLTTCMPYWVQGHAEFGRHGTLPTRDPLRILVSPPRGAAFNVRLRRDPARRWLWRAWLRFSVPGSWVLSPDERRWAYAPRSCAPTLRVRVSEP